MAKPQIAVHLEDVSEEMNDEYLDDLLAEALEGVNAVDRIEWEMGNSKAIVTLKNQEVANSLLDKRKLVIDEGKGGTLRIKMHEQLLVTTEVLVGNLPVDFKESKLRLLFRRDGLHSQIKSVTKLTDSSAVVSFQNMQDAAKAAQTKPMKYGDNSLSIQLYENEPLVYVGGIPKDFDEEAVGTILGEIMDKDDNVKDIKLLPENGAAKVTFKNGSDTKELLKRKACRLEDYGLSLTFSDRVPSSKSKSKPEASSTPKANRKDSEKATVRDNSKVTMSQLPSRLDEEKLQMFFESARWHGGPVTDIEYHEETKTAVVTFEESSDAEALVDQGHLDIRGSRVEIQWYESKGDQALDFDPERTIVVSGLPSRKDETDIQDYFENTRQKAGPVEKVELDEDSRTAFVCFENSEDAERMVNNKTMKWKSDELTIRWYETKSADSSEDDTDVADKSKILVKCLPSGIDEEDIQNFFESRRQDGGPVESVEYDDRANQAVITFEYSSDAERMLNKGELVMKKSTVILERYQTKGTGNNSSVLVSGLPKNVDEDYIHTFFEQKKNDGGIVEKVEYESGDESAVVIFEDRSVAERMVEKSTMKMKQNKIKLEWYKQKPKRPARRHETGTKDVSAEVLLEVTNIPASCAENHLKLTVESSVLPDIVSIVDMSFNPSSGRAIMKFGRDNVVRKIIDKHKETPMALERHTLDLKGIDSKNLGKHALCANSCALSITNLPMNQERELLKEALEFVFDNARFTDNEQVQHLYISKDMSRAVITYRLPKVAEFVKSKHKADPSDMTVDDQKVEVEIIPALAASLECDTDMEERILYVSNLPDCISSREISQFVKLCSDQQVKRIIYSQNPGDALVEFDENPDFQKLFEHFCMKPLEGNMVKPMRVEQSKTLEVYGVCKPKEISESTVKLYFESRKAGGGKVESVEIDTEMDCAIVKFKTVKGARDSLVVPRHLVQNQEIKVKLHHECIGLLPDWFDCHQPPNKGPREIQVPCGGIHIIRFLLQSHKQKKDLEESLLGISGEIDWPNIDRISDINITVRCILEEDCDDYKSLTATWEDRIRECVKVHVTDLHQAEIPLTSLVLADVEALVRKKYSKKSDEVMVMLIKDGQKSSVVTAGLTDRVRATSADINKEISTIKRRSGKNLRFKSLEITSLKTEELTFLEQTEFDKAIEEKYEDCSVNIDPENGKLTFHGTDNENEKAKREMEHILHNLNYHSQVCSAETITMFKKEEVVAYAMSSLKEAGLTRVAFVVGPETLEVMCDKDLDDLENAVEHLRKCVQDKSLPLDQDAVIILKSQPWKDLETDISQQHGMKLNLMECPSSIRIIATKDIVDKVYDEIEDFFKQNSVAPEFISTGKSVAKLFDRASELPQIHDKFPGSSVKIRAELGGGNPGILVKVESEIKDEVIKEVKSLASAVVHKMHVVTQPGMPDYFKKEKSGHSSLKNIEKDFNVVIELEDETTTSEEEETASVPTRCTSIVAVDLDDVKVELIHDDILKQNCDAVVVPVTKELEPIKGPGKRVFDKAGEVVNRDLKKQKHRTMRSKQCLTTKAGSLPLKILIHSVFPHGSHDDVDNITKALIEIWKTMDSKRLCTVALPGNMFENLPSNTAASAIKKSLRDARNVTEVVVVAEDKSTMLTLKRIATILSPDYSKTEDYMGFNDPVLHKFALYKEGDDGDTVCTPEGVNVILVRDEIAQQQVDIIVNTANSDFQLKVGAVSNSILKAGGNRIQRECDEIVRKRGFSPETIVETTGGSLRCKKIYHITLNNWGTGNNLIKQDVSSKVTGCLAKASKARHRSIAFPALGTGNLGYPKEYVAKLMYETVYKFSKQNPRSGLKEVKLVVYHEDESTFQKFDEISHEVCLPNYYGLPDGQATIVRPKVETPQKRRTLYHGRLMVTKKAVLKDFASHDVQIGGIFIQLSEGDITEEKTDAIVNSTDSNLSFESQLSRAILQAGGRKIKSECAEKGRITDVCITGAGDLLCNKVIHIAAPNKDTEWKQRIFATLELADLRKLNSISFPALGTGAMHIAPEIMCEVFMDAIASFVDKKPGAKLDLIRLVIFDGDTFEIFKRELTKIVNSAKARGFAFVAKKKDDKKKKRRGYVQVLPSKQNDTESESDEEPDHPIDTMVPVILKSVKLKITAFDKDSLTNVIDEIERISEAECEESEIPVSDMNILSEEQIAAIKKLEKFHAVSIDMDNNCVRVKGRGKETGVAYRKITDILQEAERNKAMEKEQETVFDTARWQFYNRDDDDFEDYPIDINYKIEMAHKAQYPFVDWTENDELTYKIEFGIMQEYPAGDRSKAIDVRKYSPAELDLPSSWVKMDPQENVKVCKVVTSAREGESVLNQIQHSMAQTNYFKELVSIERIQNKRLYRNYMINRSTVQTANPKVRLFEQKLWHGTVVNAVEGINTSGFNRVHAFGATSVTNYGKGVYFAREAEEAHQYTLKKDRKPPENGIHTMYLCKVLTGDYTKGDKEMVEPPTKPGSSKKYDSVVDDVDDPNIFVVFYDAWAYPEYLIKYKSNMPKTATIRSHGHKARAPTPETSETEDEDGDDKDDVSTYEPMEKTSYIEG